MSNTKIKAIFDNGGGLILQLGTYAHHYDDMTNAARDYLVYLDGDDTDNWDGHEDWARDVDPTIEELSNGAYREYDASDIESLAHTPTYFSWCNVQDFILAIRAAQGLTVEIID